VKYRCASLKAVEFGIHMVQSSAQFRTDSSSVTVGAEDHGGDRYSHSLCPEGGHVSGRSFESAGRLRRVYSPHYPYAILGEAAPEKQEIFEVAWLPKMDIARSCLQFLPRTAIG
jgi:hypothetical protein